MIAYTAIFGQYDMLKPHPDVDGVRWRCYTDDPDIHNPGGWEIVHEPGMFPHPRLSAKWWKCHPPQDSDRSLWIDGGVTVFDRTLIDDASHGDIAMFTHPWRDCIYDEVGASEGMIKYAGCELRQQVNRYASAGWPAHAGLWASTIIGRAHTATVREFGAAWFTHCELLTYQDQLSLPPLLARYGLSPVALPHTLTDHPGFHWGGHRSDL